MSGRSRDRPPSGRVNTAPISNHRPLQRLAPPTPLNISNNDLNGSGSGRGSAGGGSARDSYPSSYAQSPVANLSGRGKSASGRISGTNSARLDTNRTNASEMSTSEIFKRLKERAKKTKDMQESAEIQALGEFNAFSRPRPSSVLPLRSVLLDPEVNNFPRSRTRTELMQRIRYSAAPHPSYDLDNDGYVSNEDYKLAKKFDFDGNGLIDVEERDIARRVLADELFKRNANRLHVFGPQIAKKSHSKNVEDLVNSYSFHRMYDKLRTVERTLQADSSKPILDCMRVGTPNSSEDFKQHVYYTDKFDTTAWNDVERIPRSFSPTPLSEHSGSRKRLLFCRLQQTRNESQDRLDRAAEVKAAQDFANSSYSPNNRRQPGPGGSLGASMTYNGTKTSTLNYNSTSLYDRGTAVGARPSTASAAFSPSAGPHTDSPKGIQLPSPLNFSGMQQRSTTGTGRGTGSGGRDRGFAASASINRRINLITDPRMENT